MSQHGHSAQSPELSDVTLPVELQYEIISQLDPVADRSTLVTLLSVSSTFWEEAARLLYRKVTLDHDRLHRLLGVGHASETHQPTSLSARTRRALGFIHSLHIVTPLPHPDLYFLWDTALPNTPLFPGVRTLSLRDRPDYTWYNNPVPRKRPEADVLLFDSPDACVTGYQSHHQLFYLPVKRLRSLTCHHVYADNVLRDLVMEQHPAQWESLRIFDDFSGRFNDTAAPDIAAWERDIARRRQPPVQVCFQSLDAGFKARNAMFMTYGWRESPASFIKLVFYRSSDECKPCGVCGKL